MSGLLLPRQHPDTEVEIEVMTVGTPDLGFGCTFTYRGSVLILFELSAHGPWGKSKLIDFFRKGVPRETINEALDFFLGNIRGNAFEHYVMSLATGDAQVNARAARARWLRGVGVQDQ